jgi:ABC-type uncharacterized transport system permease subunit
MQEMSIFWLRVATALYAVGLLHAILTILRKSNRLFPLAVATFAVGAVLHLVSLVEMGFILGHLPADNFYETSSMAGFLFALLFLFVYWRYNFASPAVVVFPLVFLMTLAGAMAIPISTWSNPRVRDAWLLVHVFLVLCGYAAILLMAIASLFYLVQERNLKRKSLSLLRDKLPPLGTLDGLISSAMGTGFVFITLGVVVGSIWAYIELGTKWIGDTRIAISMITWAFYMAATFLRVSSGWRGRKAAFLALSVLGFSVVTWVTHAGLRPLLEQ